MATSSSVSGVSKTAVGSAVWRALGSLEPDSELRCPDSLASLFLPPGYSLAPRLPWLARLGNRLYGRLLPGGYQFEIARTKHMDHLLEVQLRSGLRQLVILGAGYDTRAYRFKDQLENCAVFEVDMPAIQEDKRRRLAASGIDTTPQLRYVAVGRDHEDLFAKLRLAGYEDSARSFFIWSGVTMYLQRESLDRTLMEIKRNAGLNSEIVFDYFSPASVSGKGEEYGARQVARRVRKLGEPLSLGLDQDEVESLLDQLGFDLVSNLGPDDLERLYLTTDDRSLGRPYGFAWIGEARTRREE